MIKHNQHDDNSFAQGKLKRYVFFRRRMDFFSYFSEVTRERKGPKHHTVAQVALISDLIQEFIGLVERFKSLLSLNILHTSSPLRSSN